MSFLDKISDSINETGQEIKKMADQTSAKGQMHLELRKKDKELESLVNRIGFKMVTEAPELCEQICPDLYKLFCDTKESAEETKKKLASLEGEVICPACGSCIKLGNRFCTNCGVRLPEQEGNPAAETPVQEVNQTEAAQGPACTQCGAPLKPGAAFCINCGAKLEEPHVEEAEPENEDEPEYIEEPEYGDEPEYIEETEPAEETETLVLEEGTEPVFEEEESGLYFEYDEPAANVCKNCGAELIEGNLFCTHCGTKI